MSEKRERLIIINNNTKDGKGSASDFDTYLLLVESTGQVLCSHICSRPGFARSDLHDRQEERKAKFEKMFPQGYDVMFLEEADIDVEVLVERHGTVKPIELPGGPELAKVVLTVSDEDGNEREVKHT